jgi:glycosyltransferase involved in cell wall biosynthesis
MAVFNGERYLRSQLDSILVQLRTDDEIIIVNDCSSDNSVNVIRGLNDARIRLVENTNNIGPSASFERAISLACGKYIFLSDQDDIWLPDKVSAVCKVFEESNAVLICSDARIVDANENLVQESLFALRRAGSGFWRNIYKNGFVGCCMAFRSAAREYFMPFPVGVGMHDEWIGLCSSIAGRVHFFNKKLIDYRRHGGNATQLVHGSVLFMVRKRLTFLRLVIGRLPALIRWRIDQSMTHGQ